VVQLPSYQVGCDPPHPAVVGGLAWANWLASRNSGFHPSRPPLPPFDGQVSSHGDSTRIRTACTLGWCIQP
jgi:hypothetical protein